MPLMLYPHSEDASTGTYIERIEQLMEAAERYKAAVLEITAKLPAGTQEVRVFSPKDLTVAFNWDIIAVLLREIRALPEATKEEKDKKNKCLTRLAEVYEVLRGAKMPKLEAVRVALTNEANQLTGGTAGAPKVA